MKFVSKSANLRVVLKPGLPAEPATGRIATPGVYVRFEQGIANVVDKDLSELMLRHDGFQKDFICSEEGDPFSYMRKSIEPSHVVTEMEFGHPVARTPDPRVDTRKLMSDAIADVIKNVLPSLIKDALKAEKGNSEPIEIKLKKKGGRPKKEKKIIPENIIEEKEEIKDEIKKED